jgi:type IV secretory pathway VirB9-like protein
MTRLFSMLVLLAVVARPALAQGTREVTVDAHAVVRVNAKVRFTTLIVLPETEEILDVVCGDKDFWVISGAQNLAYVKPAKAGAATNLNLITATGHIYSFLLAEGSADPDLKIYVAPERPPVGVSLGARVVVPAQVEALRKDVDAAREDAESAREAAAQAIEAAKTSRDQAVAAADARVAAFRAAYPMTLAFPYRFQANLKPFFVSAIFTDGTATYIKSQGHETPTLYEIRDHVPSIVNFDVRDGFYVVPKVMDSGVLVLGTHRFEFDRLP